MQVINTLTMEDVERSKQTPITPLMLAGAFTAVLEGCNLFVDELALPPLKGLLQPPEKDLLFLGLFYRVIGFSKTATELKSIVHQQTLTTIDRSVLELLIDMELLHQAKVENGIAKCATFVRAQRLKAARRMVKHYADNPQFDTTPSLATSHAELIAREATLIEAQCKALWGTNKAGGPIVPEHWSEKNLLERAVLLGPEMVHRVTDGYDIRNYAVHTGLAGVNHLDQQAFGALCQMALQSISASVVAVLAVIGKEFELYKAVPHYWEILKDVEESQYFVLTDKRLQALGEKEQRFGFVPTPP